MPHARARRARATEHSGLHARRARELFRPARDPFRRSLVRRRVREVAGVGHALGQGHRGGDSALVARTLTGRRRDLDGLDAFLPRPRLRLVGIEGVPEAGDRDQGGLRSLAAERRVIGQRDAQLAAAAANRGPGHLAQPLAERAQIERLRIPQTMELHEHAVGELGLGDLSLVTLPALARVKGRDGCADGLGEPGDCRGLAPESARGPDPRRTLPVPWSTTLQYAHSYPRLSGRPPSLERVCYRSQSTPMSSPPLHLLLRGPFNFFRPEAEELRALVPEPQISLPQPQQVFLDDESSTPLYGFPVLQSSGMRALVQSLEDYLQAEEELQVAMIRRQTYDRKQYGVAWDRYRTMLSRAVENVSLSSNGRHHPAVFWLSQTVEVARMLKETPKRVLRLDLQVGREHGEAVKYRVLERFLTKCVAHLRRGERSGARHRRGRGGALPSSPHPLARQRPDFHREPHQRQPRRAQRLFQRLPAHRWARSAQPPRCSRRVAHQAAANRLRAALGAAPPREQRSGRRRPRPVASLRLSHLPVGSAAVRRPAPSRPGAVQAYCVASSRAELFHGRGA